MAKSMELGVFSQKFLSAQDLEGFALSFDAFRGKQGRRAKRTTVLIEAEKPDAFSRLQGSRTVADLLSRFHKLAPKTVDWTEPGPNCYRLRLRDHKGQIVGENETLAALRDLQENEHNQALERAKRSVLSLLKDLERQLEADDIDALVRAALKERYGS